MRHKTLYILIIVIFLASCSKKKESNVLFTGIVLNYENGNPVESEQIKIIRFDNGEYPSITLSDTIITNNQGIYNFSFENNQYNRYLVRSISDQTAEKNWRHKKTKDITSGSINQDTIIVGKAAYLEVTIIRSNDHKDYKLGLNMDRPVGDIDPQADYNKYMYSIPSVDSTFIYHEKYFYPDNNNVYVSLAGTDSITMDTISKVIEKVELIPLDTRYITFDLR